MAIDSGQLTGNNTAVIATDPTEYRSQALDRELITQDIGDSSGNVNLKISPDGGSNYFVKSVVTLGEPLQFKAFPNEQHAIVVDSGGSPDLMYWIF